MTNLQTFYFIFRAFTHVIESLYGEILHFLNLPVQIAIRHLAQNNAVRDITPPRHYRIYIIAKRGGYLLFSSQWNGANSVFASRHEGLRIA